MPSCLPVHPRSLRGRRVLSKWELSCAGMIGEASRLLDHDKRVPALLKL